MNKKTIIGIICAVIVIAIIGGIYFFTGNSNNNNSHTINAPNVNLGNNDENNNEALEDENNNEVASTEENTSSEGLKTLVVYFSVPETDNPNNMTRDEDNSTVVVNGEVLDNTQYIAQLIQERTSADIFRLEPTNAYPTDHSELLARAQEEMQNDVKPEIKGSIENFEQYDVIFVGYPIWWHTAPMIIGTFLENYDLTGVEIYPFTQSSSMDAEQFENSMDFVRENAKAANVHDGLFVKPSDTDGIHAYLVENGFIK